MKPVLVLLGSNIQPERHIPQAKAELQQLVADCVFSRTYLTAPVGDPHQPSFWNLAAKGKTTLSVEVLQRQLALLEARHGRVRDPARPCGPRTLDLDLLLYDQLVGRFGSLELPSPLLSQQAFVLVPAAEVAPQWLHPVLQKPQAELVVSQ
ncbi:MAG: 2-amino-4-hydroxy-6-hydroxymethyldihydropteridine diphosphokinase, partial [Thermoanaerobaculum sp.]